MGTDHAACLDETAVLGLLDGGLDATLASGVEAHLAGCRDCRELVSELARSSRGGRSRPPSLGKAERASPLARAAGDSAAPPPTSTYSEGLVLGGRFRLLRLLGVGGMGAVWAAQHLVTRREVALKLAKGLVNERERRRFLREARVVGALDHPGIVPIRDAFELDDGTPVLVMDLLVGRSLRDHLRERVRLSPAELIELMRPLLAALASAHASGVTHRDLKPENIFLVEEHGKSVLKVLDFGIAKLATAEELSGETTRTGEILGTPFYMAPEQAFGEPVDPRADLWALGVLFYECLAGERPFGGENLGQLLKAVTTGTYRSLAERCPDVPASLVQIVERLLVVDREQRIGSVDALRHALEHPTRTPGRARVIAAALAAVIALAAGITWRVTHTPAAPVAVAPVAPRVAPPAPPIVEPSRSTSAANKEESYFYKSPAASHPAPPPTDERASSGHHARPSARKLDPADKRLPGGVVGDAPY